MAKLYDKNSIESVSPLEFVRMKPGVYAGNTDFATQLLIEGFSNSIDEFNLGHGSKIDVQVNLDSSIILSDEGQGFLINEIRDDGKTVLEAAFSVLNTSGKYRDDGAYEGTSLGAFGIGCKLICFLSSWLQVTTYRDNKFETINFKDGVFESREVGNLKHISGTTMTWLPDKQFFGTNDIEYEKIRTLFKTVTCLCKGLTVNFAYKNKPIETFISTNGLNDLVDDAVKGKEIISNRFECNKSVNKLKIDLVMTYTSNYSSTIIPYVNTGLTESGPHLTQFKTIITREFNKFFREKNWLKEKDDNLTGDDVQEGLYMVFNITAPSVKYDAQIKSRVTGIEIKDLYNIFSNELQDWLTYNEKNIKIIADKAILARTAREKARKAREAVRETSKKKETGLKAKMSISNKFIDCSNKTPANRNLLLVEGVSAGSAAVEARNPKTDCIYMLRGKTVSPLKTAVDKICANQEMSDIIQVIGAGFGNNFDLSKMQFDKIVITSDQDADGLDIELLLTTFFYTYMRPLVEAGKLYRAVTPLYIIRYKGKEYYAYTEAEFDEWKKKHSGGYDVLRAKGLGELNAQDLRSVCFENERYKRITISDAQKTTELLNILMGPSAELRKRYIYENATELGFHFD